VKEYKIYCHLSTIVLKKIMASSFENAVQISKSGTQSKIVEIVEQFTPCEVDMELSIEANKPFDNSSHEHQHQHDINYESWGSE